MNITITRKQAEDMIKLIDKSTPISKGVVIGFLQSRLDEKSVNHVHHKSSGVIDFCNSDRV